jgi:hypothetical protein
VEARNHVWAIFLRDKPGLNAWTNETLHFSAFWSGLHIFGQTLLSLSYTFSQNYFWTVYTTWFLYSFYICFQEHCTCCTCTLP